MLLKNINTASKAKRSLILERDYLCKGAVVDLHPRSKNIVIKKSTGERFGVSYNYSSSDNTNEMSNAVLGVQPDSFNKLCYAVESSVKVIKLDTKEGIDLFLSMVDDDVKTAVEVSSKKVVSLDKYDRNFCKNKAKEHGGGEINDYKIDPMGETINGMISGLKNLKSVIKD